jgi:hypothetical protein
MSGHSLWGKILLIDNCSWDPVTRSDHFHVQWRMSEELHCLCFISSLICVSLGFPGYSQPDIFLTYPICFPSHIFSFSVFFFFCTSWSIFHSFRRLCYIYIKYTHFFPLIIRKVFIISVHCDMTCSWISRPLINNAHVLTMYNILFWISYLSG